MSLLSIRNLIKLYPMRGGEIEALNLDSFDVEAGESVLIDGVSGSGKTTLLHIIAGFINPTSGSVIFGGTDILTIKHMDKWRGMNIGYIFQNMNLLPDMNAFENVLIASEIVKKKDAERAKMLLYKLGLKDRIYNRPSELSLGEQQRVAAARAVVNAPALVIADEPTASLDLENSRLVLSLLSELSKDYGSSLIIATHDSEIKKKFSKTLSLGRSRMKARCRADECGDIISKPLGCSLPEGD